MRRFRVFPLVALFVWLTGCGSGGSGSTGAPAGIPGIDGIRKEFLEAVNAARAVDHHCGATPYGPAPSVTWDDGLALAAYRHSSDMAAHNFFSHTGSDGSSAGDRIAAEGYAWSTYGENIAVGYPSIASVMQGWLESEGHCRNIMNPAFREIGAALAEGAYLGSPQAPYWTFDLAAPR